MPAATCNANVMSRLSLIRFIHVVFAVLLGRAIAQTGSAEASAKSILDKKCIVCHGQLECRISICAILKPR